ncbi:MAG: 50S ribosomal protein L24 [Candidatus Magasanikbacteria bacterium RIFCSPHIGHO2_01_FULL_41_23]|uniref:Large ribosomal subunit protein uL24 n=1 Tax=Candidatus Magasanikbacteria bacterium RIFCSPLOWO2_01_FULL_40_15 TaxID=1798686 RepID=A0A1F6N272_9BACT|nr:MAG: 50S ribosomal protein L24 [Candidatus Magasanikbacteria bacterium RIFCSPHIGHO2_01_FULL_41_23]OGH66822.1 MAG: 50S ribosomal protein L24 [Candidatus Magasanikbacteria bacterium RIFCSPHIGHO2_02_FULL_41_35]OGH76658.1 MAG: 50S ribosomal protein L24 [Candidatus Magasanikbacteria bacterium RIFCSPHIGHO2_12_FULL_41_16]OGH77994.1 MAG: 50S ribosomal protein L24 [Candidatus Magasanikbacteria bacterium RIFCSPLOWO2_01_FULL_40_15]
MKIKKNDIVKVLAGKDRNKTGKVIQILLGKNGEAGVVVEGINKLKKHLRSRKNGEKGQAIELPAPIPMSRVMLIDPKTNKPTRISYRLEGTTKVRVAKKSGETIS